MHDFSYTVYVFCSLPEVQFVCLDVANGYSEHFVKFVARVRAAFPKHTIMVSGGSNKSNTSYNSISNSSCVINKNSNNKCSYTSAKVSVETVANAVSKVTDQRRQKNNLRNTFQYEF